MSFSLSQTVQGYFMAWVRGTDMPSAPQNLEIGLLTGLPNHDGTGVNEPNNLNGYSRQAVSFDAATVNGQVTTIQNSSALVFGPVTGSDWPTVTHAAVFDADTGDMLWYGPLPASRTAPVGDSASFGAGAIQFKLK